MLTKSHQHYIHQPWRYKQPRRTRQMREKTSVGIACCRMVDSRPEILLICKRYTYAYNMFVHGKYDPYCDTELVKLFGGMTVNEKIDILSLNFKHMWYKIWLNAMKNTSTYQSSKNKFKMTFCTEAGQARLRALIAKSPTQRKVWEIPKGRKKNRDESDIQCAVREFGEETGIDKKSYRVYDYTYNYSYVDDNVTYKNTYYLAIMDKIYEPRMDFSLPFQIDEVSDISWMDINEVRKLGPRLTATVEPIFSMYKKARKI